MKKKILLVEYATTSIDIIKEILSHPTFEITIASEGDTAKQYLEEKSFDLMITAAMLPKFHGFNLSQYAAENYPGIKIIIMSEIYKGMDYKHQATTLYRADDFFEKPFDKEVFKKRVLELLDISEETIKDRSRVNTKEVPEADTQKLPTLKNQAKEEKKLSSADLFGDIIEEIHDLPAYEIQLESGADKGKNIETKKITVPTTGPAVTQVLKTQEAGKTQKIDLEFLDLIKTGKKEKKPEVKKPEQKFKKIESDISRKLEDTLSGLGLTAKPTPAPSRTPSPAAAQAPARTTAPAAVKETALPTEQITPATPEKLPGIITETKEKADEVGGYEILGLIGRGGMAEIYKAKKKGVKGFEKIIALKKILSGYGTDAKFIEMFVDEAKIAAELSHPNIVQIHDLGKKDDYYFIAMEYVSGKDLRVILQKLIRLGIAIPEELAIYLVIKVLEALNYAHAARDTKGKKLEIVHRDVSPPNILVSYEGQIKLTDFGVSKASTKMHQTLAGALKGKLLYMSPEQARGESNIDYRSDLYSAGIILFELITGEKLFLGSSEIVTLKKVQEGTVIKPSLIKNDIEPELETIILKALNINITQRYQRASDFIRDLEIYMSNHYDSMPETPHIAHFIWDLFKEEIVKERIQIHMPPPPAPIIKKSKKETVPEEEIKVGVEIIDLPEETEENLLEPLPRAPEKQIEEKEMKTEIGEEEEFQPIIEINLDEEEKKVVPPAPPPSPAPPFGITPFESLTLDEEARKKKRLVTIIILIVVLALAIVVFLIVNPLGSGTPGPGTEGSEPGPGTGAVMTGTPGTGETAGTPTSTTTEMPANQPGIKPADQSQPPTPTTPPTAQPGTQTPEKKPVKEEPLPKEKTAGATKVTTPSPLTPQPSKETARDETGKKKPKEVITEPAAVKTREQASQKDKPGGEEKKTGVGEEPQPAEAKPTPETLKEKPAEDTAPGPEPQETLKEGDILSPSQVDTQPIPVSTPPIGISSSIRRLLTSDQRILVSYLVDHNGNVETVQVLSQSSLKRLNTEITENIKKWKYKPATKNNIKVKVWKNQWIAIKK